MIEKRETADGEPSFSFLASDEFAIQLLKVYRSLCMDYDAPGLRGQASDTFRAQQCDALTEHIQAVKEWRGKQS